jgi:hypothetical protein
MTAALSSYNVRADPTSWVVFEIKFPMRGHDDLIVKWVDGVTATDRPGPHF